MISFIIFEKSTTSEAPTWTQMDKHPQAHTQKQKISLHIKGVNVKCCFYLIIGTLKGYLTWQTADEALICSLMFPPSPSITSSSVSLSLPQIFFVVNVNFLFDLRNDRFCSVSFFLLLFLFVVSFKVLLRERLSDAVCVVELCLEGVYL